MFIYSIYFIFILFHKEKRLFTLESKINCYIEKMKSVPRSDDNVEIMFPGEPELRRMEERLKNGIPINDKTYEEVIELAKEYNINFEG